MRLFIKYVMIFFLLFYLVLKQHFSKAISTHSLLLTFDHVI